MAQVNALPLLHSVMGRVSLVDANLSAARWTIEDDLAATVPDALDLATDVECLLSTIDDVGRHAMLQDSLLLERDPRVTAASGLRLMRGVLRDYTPYAGRIFDGYEPIADDPTWAAALGRDDVANFGSVEEPLIALAVQLDKRNMAPMTYRDLHAAGKSRGRIA